VTKLDWEFAVRRDGDLPFTPGKDGPSGPGHHLDEPDDFERLENSFDSGPLGMKSDKGPPYLIVSKLTLA